MRKIDRLKKQALEACRERGHEMGRFKVLSFHEPWLRPRRSHEAAAECKLCGMRVECNTRPAANDIEIGGEAVALNCK